MFLCQGFGYFEKPNTESYKADTKPEKSTFRPLPNVLEVYVTA